MMAFVVYVPLIENFQVSPQAKSHGDLAGSKKNFNYEKNL
jgi:hypothetical protein